MYKYGMHSTVYHEARARLRLRAYQDPNAIRKEQALSLTISSRLQLQAKM